MEQTSMLLMVEIIGVVISSILVPLVIFSWKTISTRLKKIECICEASQKRHAVVQQLISDIAETPIDTAVISEDYSRYPRIPAFVRRER